MEEARLTLRQMLENLVPDTETVQITLDGTAVVEGECSVLRWMLSETVLSKNVIQLTGNVTSDGIGSIAVEFD